MNCELGYLLLNLPSIFHDKWSGAENLIEGEKRKKKEKEGRKKGGRKKKERKGFYVKRRQQK